MTGGIVPLEAAGDPLVAGTKACTLGRLRRAGFAVPDGFVLPADFPVQEPASASGAAQVSGEAGGDGAAFGALGAALRRWIGDGSAVAVRSSAPAEDGAAHSYAGQYVSVLDVSGDEEVAAAVARCRAGAADVRAARYHRRAHGEASDGGPQLGMPVLVQRMVYPEWAGVLFSVDPVHPDPAVLVVEAAARSAAAVCDGAVTPLRYRVDRVSLAVLDSPAPAGPAPTGPAPTAALIAEVARTGLALERALEGPQDVEWAAGAARDGALAEITVLQSRAITTLPGPTGPAPSLAESLSWL